MRLNYSAPTRLHNTGLHNAKNPAIVAFSLIEVIGVLAIIAIAAAVLLPNLVKRVDIAAANAEAKLLDNMAESLNLYIKRNWRIPSHTNWADVIAEQMGWDRGTVLTNDRRIARAFLIDPNLRIAGGTLPYTQRALGSTNRPTNARIMIVSSLFDTLPVSSGATLSSNDFNTIWNTPEGQVPSIWSTWRGRNSGDLLKIKRINLESLFKYVSINKSPDMPRLIFGVATNYDLSGVDRMTNSSPTFATYYLEGSIIYLYRTNGALDFRQILESDTSFYFAQNNWGGQPMLGAQITGMDFQNCADFFSMALPNSNAKDGATPQLVLNAIIDYMNAYVAWANTGFDKKSPQYTALQNAQTTLDRLTTGLIWNPRP